MNSDNIIRQLNRMITEPRIAPRWRAELSQVVAHIKLQDREIAELKEDITTTNFDDE